MNEQPKTKNVKCPCGQDNELVKTADGWVLDAARHGCSAPGDRCFNCHAPLAIEPEPVKSPAPKAVQTTKSKKKSKSRS